ncbi:MAG: hypothetical protein GWN94_02575, partial [Phycisphaerae bacterium]|nr:hypothetical protein [Phycisphaerae bacterium]NIS49993.1 hypothetical protein [Phycisphaerae bacterium]NIX29584.1 hypothetical protein [Phycisphaerae bacterium]
DKHANTTPEQEAILELNKVIRYLFASTRFSDELHRIVGNEAVPLNEDLIKQKIDAILGALELAELEPTAH